MSKEPERTCIVCRKKGSKENFIKVVKNKTNEIFIVKDKKSYGRGAYICKDSACLEKCKKTKALNRVFKMPIPENIYEELISGFGDK